ncbi:g12854 [Coccomyxa viridis]|uniref:G12854 protein n=1 Tax=Coccomyxa viridis TaxID=1274662 RepID=A0ABP1GE09_9CHLO
MSGASLQVTNIPSHVTQDEFTRLFGQAQGCIGARLVKIGNTEPVGYLDFLDPPSAGKAISTYSGWKGWGMMGLVLRPSQPAPGPYPGKREREDAVVDPRLMKQMRPAAPAYGAANQGYAAQADMRSPLHGQANSNQAAAQARAPVAQPGNANSLAYGMDSVQPASRNTASAPPAYGGPPAGQQALSVQQLEAQRQQVRASILSQMGAPQAAQQPAYANDPRYPVSSLPPINNSAAGVNNLGPGMLPVVEDRGPTYAPQQQQQHQGYQQFSQAADMKSAQGGLFTGASQPARPAIDPINIGPGLLQSLQSLTQTHQQPPQQQAYLPQQQQPQQPQYMQQPQPQPQLMPQHMQQQQLPPQQQLAMPQHAAPGYSQPQYQQLPPQQNGMQPSMPQEPIQQQAGQYGVGEIGTAVEEEELPPEAHHTLFMSGMPLDIQKREATHIFRPFEGYKELRLVQKTDKQGKNVMWCFVEFEEIVQAARCMKVLQGYSLDEEDPTAYQLRISYARPPQSGPGSQRVPTQGGRNAGPPRKGPQHDQRRDNHAHNKGPRTDDKRRNEGGAGGGQYRQDRGGQGGQDRNRPPPNHGGRGPGGYNRR